MRKYEIKIELEDSIISGEKHENRGMEGKACENEICEDEAAVIGEFIIWIAFQQGKNFNKFKESKKFVNMVKDHH